ncbi:MAG TPA: hypothetical protein DEB09_00745 [Candidatus Magasanikbacteria bacterium]|nr:hypothetical protein [Candidatus Magasanikbacteria bacterium]
MQITDYLQQFGLNKKQAEIYLACLKLGPSKVGNIQKESQIKRTTLYDILSELEKQGLIIHTTKQKTRIYSATSPDKLSELVEQKKTAIQTIMPDLQELFFSIAYRPNVRFYEGNEGIKEIYKETLNCKDKKILQIVSVKDFVEFPGKNFMEWYVKERAKKNITAKAIHPKSGDVYNNFFGINDDALKREVRYMPKSLFSMSMMMIYDNNVVAMSTKKENYGFVIESKEYSTAMRTMFEFLWGLGSKEHN